VTSIAKESPHGSQAPPTRPRIASRATSTDNAGHAHSPAVELAQRHRAPAPPARRRALAPARREVPEIRLSGAWLERIGFPKGARYLISVEREVRTIILQGSFDKARKRS
jgi:hypothetical protein